MNGARVTRREFMGDSAKVAAGVVVGAGVAGGSVGRGDETTAVDTAKILNYNENMEYRRQGSTNLMISAVCLGRHSRNDIKERTEIVSRSIDAGINYIDSFSG